MTKAKAIPFAIEYVRGIAIIATIAALLSLISFQEMSVIFLTNKIATYIKAAASTSFGSDVANGANPKHRRKAIPTTILTNPVRPPALIPAPLSTYDVTVDVPINEPATVPTESATSGPSIFSTSPFLFNGDKNEQNKLSKILSSNSLTLQEGGRVINLCDNINKVKSMNKVIKILKKTEDKIKSIAVGDNYNDLDMLKNCDVPCLVFNDKFKLDQINIDNLVFSNMPSPEGWADVIKKALAKLNYNV